jgi:putative transposase
MNSLSQLIGKYTNITIKEKINEVVQLGSVQHVICQEINSMISTALNEALSKEATVELGREHYQRGGRISRNGYKKISVPGVSGKLILRKPVVRKGGLVLPLLKSLNFAGKALISLLASRMWLKGVSTRLISSEIKNTFGVPMSASQVSIITNALEPTIAVWEKRMIPEDIEYMFLDALYLPVVRQKFTSKEALLVALGIDSKGNCTVLGYLLGDRESNDSWESFLEELIAKGLRRENINMVISDEHKAIVSSVESILRVPHQLCVFHKMKNVRVRVASPDKKEFMADFKNIYWASSIDEAKRHSGILEGKWGKRYHKAVEISLRNFESYTVFFNEPKELWKSIRTSNRLERFNRELRRRLRPAGAMHTELELRKIVWTVSDAQETRWGKRKAIGYKELNIKMQERQVA